MTTETLSQYLACMFQPNTEVVKQATRVLKQYFKREQALEQLLILMASSPDQNIRQVSCVYLRKIITNLWLKLPAGDQQQTKNLLLTRFQQEPVFLIKKNIADVIGQLGKILIPNKEWNELFLFIFQFTQSESLQEKEHGMILLSVIIEYFSASEINQYYAQLHPIIITYLQSGEQSLKRLAVVTVNNLT
jgi:hypothetical protein